MSDAAPADERPRLLSTLNALAVMAGELERRGDGRPTLVASGVRLAVQVVRHQWKAHADAPSVCAFVQRIATEQDIGAVAVFLDWLTEADDAARNAQAAKLSEACGTLIAALRRANPQWSPGTRASCIESGWEMFLQDVRTIFWRDLYDVPGLIEEVNAALDEALAARLADWQENEPMPKRGGGVVPRTLEEIIEGIEIPDSAGTGLDSATVAATIEATEFDPNGPVIWCRACNDTGATNGQPCAGCAFNNLGSL